MFSKANLCKYMILCVYHIIVIRTGLPYLKTLNIFSAAILQILDIISILVLIGLGVYVFAIFKQIFEDSPYLNMNNNNNIFSVMLNSQNTNNSGSSPNGGNNPNSGGGSGLVGAQQNSQNDQNHTATAPQSDFTCERRKISTGRYVLCYHNTTRYFCCSFTWIIRSFYLILFKKGTGTLCNSKGLKRCTCSINFK